MTTWCVKPLEDINRAHFLNLMFERIRFKGLMFKGRDDLRFWIVCDRARKQPEWIKNIAVRARKPCQKFVLGFFLMCKQMIYVL